MGLRHSLLHIAQILRVSVKRIFHDYTRETPRPGVVGQQNTEIKPVPGSRSKMIFYDIPVYSPPLSAENYEQRFRYVVNELRTVVFEDEDLRLCGRHINFSRHMIGASKDTSVPSILVECRERDLKALRQLFNKHAARLRCYKESTWQNLIPHEALTPKPVFQLVYLSHAHHPTRQYAAHEPVMSSTSTCQTLCGSLVECDGRLATIGLTLVVDGTSRVMTVDHLFNSDIEDETSLYTTDDCSVSAIGSNEKTTCTTAADDHGCTPSDATMSSEGRVVKHLKPLHPAAPYLDWAFVDLTGYPESFRSPNIIFPKMKSAPVLLRRFARKPRSHTTQVYMISGINGTRKGRLFSGLSELGPQQKREPCRVWKMLLDPPQGLDPGECGSLVVDQKNFEVYGHVIGSNVLEDVFVVPLAETIGQIRAAFNATTVTLPSQEPLLPSSVFTQDDNKRQKDCFSHEQCSSLTKKQSTSEAANGILRTSSFEPLDGSVTSSSSPPVCVRFSAQQENRPHINVLREAVGLEVDEIGSFMDSYPSSLSAQRSVERVEGFCSGASFALDVFVPYPHSLTHPRSIIGPENTYNAVVNDATWDNKLAQYNNKHRQFSSSQQLHKLLKEKRLKETQEDICVVKQLRRIYINNPDGASILALIRTAPPSQVDILRRMLTTYITPNIDPYISLDERSWWGKLQHQLSFQFPFFMLVPQSYNDSRSISERTQPFRTKLGLSFLDTAFSRIGPQQTRDCDLYEAVVSFGIVVHSGEYWTAYCFEDGDIEVSVFGLEFDDVEDLLEEPSIKEHSAKSLFLDTMSSSLLRALDHYESILDLFRELMNEQISDASSQEYRRISPRLRETLNCVLSSVSRLQRTVKQFLSDDPKIDLDQVPQNTALPNHRGPDRIDGLLRRITKSCDRLQDIELVYHQLITKLELAEVKEEDNAPTRVYEPSVRQLTIAAFMLAILSLMLQGFVVYGTNRH